MSPIVLKRDERGREVLWQCSECGQPFTLGWGDYCNRCLAAAKRHAELIEAIQGIKPERNP